MKNIYLTTAYSNREGARIMQKNKRNKAILKCLKSNRYELTFMLVIFTALVTLFVGGVK